MATFEEIKRANESIKTLNVKGKEYAEVNQRIKAFRMLYPTGFISTEMLSNENGVCVFRAECGYYEGANAVLLGTGTAYEKESSSYINKTSYIENCETSAVGRALGMCGFGIDVSVASAEEVQNAIHNQELQKLEEKHFCKGKNCGVEIDVMQAAITEKEYGKPLCKECEAKAKAYYDKRATPNAPRFEVEK